MKAIILAAGIGSRLRPFTDKTPKCCVKIDGKRLIDYQIETLKLLGINKISIVGGYLSHKLPKKGINVIKNNDYKNTNMVYSLKIAEDEIHGNVLISYGDIVYSPHLLEKIIKDNHAITVPVDKNWKKYWEARSSNPLSDLESMKIDNENTIYNIGQKVSDYADIYGQYMGLIKLNNLGSTLFKTGLREIEEGKYNGKKFESMYMTDFIMYHISKGIKIHALYNDEPWIEIDTCEDLESKISLTRIKAIKMQIEAENTRKRS